MKILHIDTSISGDTSVSRQLSKAAVDRLLECEPGALVMYRDLVRQPLPHLGGGQANDLAAAGDADPGRAVLQEFIEADVIVLGVAFYNLSIASQLKAWIDRVVVAGETFRYDAGGPKGLAGGKRVVMAIARGGSYRQGMSLAPSEHAESYLCSIFAFIGISDIEIIAADGVSLGDAARTSATDAALALIRELQ